MAKINSSSYVEKTSVVDDDRIYGIDSEVVDPTTTEPLKYWKYSTLSGAVQDDIFDNDAVETSTVASDLIPIEQSGTQKVITPENLMKDCVEQDASPTLAGDLDADNNYILNVSGIRSENCLVASKSLSLGIGARSRNANGIAQSAAQVGVVYGTNQYYSFASYTDTNDATPKELKPLEESTSYRLTIEENGIFNFRIMVAGSNSDGTVAGFYQRSCICKNIAGTTALVGSVQTIGTDIEAGSIGGISITASDENDALLIQVTGKASTNITWTAYIEALEIGFY